MRVPVAVETRIFGRVAGELLVPVSGERVDWRPELVFPGLREGERLTRGIDARPQRAPALAKRQGAGRRPRAEARTSPLVGIADSIAGSMQPEETREERTALYAAASRATGRLDRAGSRRPSRSACAGGRVAS